MIWVKLTCREFWVKLIPMKLSHNTYPDIQRELYFKPRISEANPETELTTQKYLKTLRLIELRIEYALLYGY